MFYFYLFFAVIHVCPPCYLFHKTLPIILEYGHYLFLRFCSLNINGVRIGTQTLVMLPTQSQTQVHLAYHLY